jgi:hypothetical protein
MNCRKRRNTVARRSLNAFPCSRNAQTMSDATSAVATRFDANKRREHGDGVREGVLAI